jgi:sensor histidine kinase YesM
MDHPFFKNIRFLLIYLALWFFIMTIHSVLLYYYYNFSFQNAFYDSIVFNLMFCLMGLMIWFPVRFRSKSKSSLANNIINQLTSAIVILLIWVASGVSILSVLNSKNPEYIVFLNDSIPLRVITGVFYYMILFLIYYLIQYYYNLQERATSEARMKEMIRDAELNMLKSQINPHFLFNSLNSVSSLTMTDPSAAQEMVIRLSEFLRYSVTEQKGQLSTFEKEIDNINKYLDIEKVRFGEKLQFEFEVCRECNNWPIPAMILQPLFENAIKHGVYESTEPIKIETKATTINEVLVVRIENNFDPTATPRKGAGIGLKNTRERLLLIYRNETLLKTSKEKNMFKVELLIPQKNEK